MKWSLIILLLVLVAFASAGDKLKVDVTMTPIVEQGEKKIWEDNAWFDIALFASVLACIWFMHLFYERVWKKRLI